VAAGGICRSVPEWSPDGKLIAYQCQVQPSATDPGYSRICVMDADGSHVHALAQTPVTGLSDGAPAWSPDGKELAFDRGVHDQHAIFVMNADGGNARQVTPWSLSGGQPDWSPDGKRLLFYSNYQGPPTVSANLYVIRPDGTGLVRLTHARGGAVQYLSASFSPDGKWIAFGRTPGTGSAGNADIYVMRANGSAVTDVTHSAIWDSGVDWGPSG
jgi:Tol biopolymer transport system component